MSEKVKLLIRSALCNGDQKFEADLDWTVIEVKKQIEQEWPSHPPPGDQRLVYAGKLLQDGSKLREVLRLDDHGQPFIVHLVSF
jgi:Ubiquitin family